MTALLSEKLALKHALRFKRSADWEKPKKREICGLAQRITMLEATAHGPDTFNDLVNVIVSPGNSNPDINLVWDQHGGEWLRQPGETAQELQVRAIAVARLTTKGSDGSQEPARQELA